MKAELTGVAEPTQAQLLRIADLAWQAMFWKFRKISAPVLADAYLRAYRRADAGDVPMSVIYDLADKHAEKIGDYFHETSRRGLAEGFNAMVNRRLPARAAANRVLDAYGLSPRQMRGFTSAKNLDNPISSVLPISVKARVRAYIDRAFTSRTRKLSRQEEHNVDEQAKQFAWMWMQDKGRLPKHAQKMWITAKDERVCVVCGPLHGQKVGINQQFKTKHGDFWTPGLHPNCRCVVRLIENRFSKAATALADDDWDPREHPRGEHGRFSTRARSSTIDVDSEFDRIVDQQIAPKHPKYSALGRTHDADLAMRFHDVVQGSMWETTTVRDHRAKTAPVTRIGPDLATQQITTTVAEIATQIMPITTQRAIATKMAAKLKVTAAPATQPVAKPEPKLKPARQSLGRTNYAVVSSNAFVEGSPGKIDVDKLTWTTDVDAVTKQAAQRMASDISDAVGSILKHGPVLDPVQHDYIMPTRKQVREMVEWYAQAEPRMHETDTFVKEPVDRPITVRVQALDGKPLYDERGQQVTRQWLLSDLGKMYELDRIPFDAMVLSVNEGYADKSHLIEGSGNDLSVHDSFKLEGRFRIKPLSGAKVEHGNIAMHSWEIEPILERDD